MFVVLCSPSDENIPDMEDVEAPETPAPKVAETEKNIVEKQAPTLNPGDLEPSPTSKTPATSPAKPHPKTPSPAPEALILSTSEIQEARAAFDRHLHKYRTGQPMDPTVLITPLRIQATTNQTLHLAGMARGPLNQHAVMSQFPGLQSHVLEALTQALGDPESTARLSRLLLENLVDVGPPASTSPEAKRALEHWVELIRRLAEWDLHPRALLALLSLIDKGGLGDTRYALFAALHAAARAGWNRPEAWILLNGQSGISMHGAIQAWPGRYSFTFSAWLQPRALQEERQTVLSFSRGDGASYILALSRGRCHLHHVDKKHKPFEEAVAMPPLAEGEWKHFAVTHEYHMLSVSKVTAPYSTPPKPSPIPTSGPDSDLLGW